MGILKVDKDMANMGGIGGDTGDTGYFKDDQCASSLPTGRSRGSMKLDSVQVQTDDSTPEISILLTNTSHYSPSWPMIKTCLAKHIAKGVLCTEGQPMLKPAGYMNNGRKSGEQFAADLIQINLCSNRYVKLQTCFVDKDEQDVTLVEAKMRYFDIDHGANKAMGPEVFQFKCPGGTFTLYGYEEEDNEESEFLVHVSASAKAKERPYGGELTVNGMPIHVYDCPANDWVTLWSSRRGVGLDNPTSTDIRKDAGSRGFTTPPRLAPCFRCAACANGPLRFHVATPRSGEGTGNLR
jgi:hypothetical protein